MLLKLSKLIDFFNNKNIKAGIRVGFFCTVLLNYLVMQVYKKGTGVNLVPFFGGVHEY